MTDFKKMSGAFYSIAGASLSRETPYFCGFICLNGNVIRGTVFDSVLGYEDVGGFADFPRGKLRMTMVNSTGFFPSYKFKHDPGSGLWIGEEAFNGNRDKAVCLIESTHIEHLLRKLEGFVN